MTVRDAIAAAEKANPEPLEYSHGDEDGAWCHACHAKVRSFKTVQLHTDWCPWKIQSLALAAIREALDDAAIQIATAPVREMLLRLEMESKGKQPHAPLDVADPRDNFPRPNPEELGRAKAEASTLTEKLRRVLTRLSDPIAFTTKEFDALLFLVETGSGFRHHQASEDSPALTPEENAACDAVCKKLGIEP